jgi:hypothetical protein
VRTTPGRSRQPPAISAAGATVAFSRGGGILVGAIVFTVGCRFRRLATHRRKPSW